VRWELREGAVDVYPPVTFQILQKSPNGGYVPDRSFELPFDRIESGSTVFRATDPDDIEETKTVLGRSSDGNAVVRYTVALRSRAPRVKLRLGMGAYCGTLTSQSVVARTGQSSDGSLQAEQQTEQYAMTTSSDAGIVSRLSLATIETPVIGPPFEAACVLDSDDYVLAYRRGQVDYAWRWQREGYWDESVVARAEKAGIRCKYPKLPSWADVGLRKAADQVVQNTLADLTAYFTEVANQGQVTASSATSLELFEWKLAHPEVSLWPPRTRSICGGEPICSIPPVNPSIFDEVCTSSDEGMSCYRSWLQVSYSTARSGAYFKPFTLASMLDFRISDLVSVAPN
jgi:hypothetical protein